MVIFRAQNQCQHRCTWESSTKVFFFLILLAFYVKHINQIKHCVKRERQDISFKLLLTFVRVYFLNFSSSSKTLESGILCMSPFLLATFLSRVVHFFTFNGE